MKGRKVNIAQYKVIPALPSSTPGKRKAGTGARLTTFWGTFRKSGATEFRRKIEKKGNNRTEKFLGNGPATRK